MSRIYWDTMLFVYLIEEHPEHTARVREIVASMERRGDTLCTSVFTIDVLRPPRVELIPLKAETAERYARIRADHRVSPADAIHLASAAYAGVNLFLTNDRRLPGLAIPGIDFIAGMDVNLF
jgi:predicted nucleic acid-binding protein